MEGEVTGSGWCGGESEEGIWIGVEPEEEETGGVAAAWGMDGTPPKN